MWPVNDLSKVTAWARIKCSVRLPNVLVQPQGIWIILSYLGYLEILQKCLQIFKAFIFCFKWKMYNFFNNDVNINNASLHAHLRQCFFHVSRTSVCEKDRCQLCRPCFHNHKGKKIVLFFFLEKLHLCFSISHCVRAQSRQTVHLFCLTQQECWNNNNSGWCKYIFKCVELTAYRAHWANHRHFKKHCKNPPGHYFRIPKGGLVRTYRHLTVNTAI